MKKSAGLFRTVWPTATKVLYSKQPNVQYSTSHVQYPCEHRPSAQLLDHIPWYSILIVTLGQMSL